MTEKLYDQIQAIQMFEQHASVLPQTTIEEFTRSCHEAALMQRGVMWWIGDLALAVERQHPRTHYQAWPEWISPDLIDRAKAVSAAYPPEDRNILATWTVHMKMAKRGDRVLAVQASVEAGQTSDEARRDPPPPQEEPESVEAEADWWDPNAWLLVIDINYYINQAFPRAGADAARTTVQWMARMIERLQSGGATGRLTDVVFVMDSTTNHRRKLTEGWETPYKDRVEKEPELVEQLKLAPLLLEKLNLPVVMIPDMEADDLMASYAKQFNGRVSLMTVDKDLRQCLSKKCNMITSVTWEEHQDTGKHVPVYQFVVAKYEPRKDPATGEYKPKPENVKCHMTDGVTYKGTKVTGITPEQWPHFQALAGDDVDHIKGCVGIGATYAMKLIQEHGTVQAVIDACKDNTADLKAAQRMNVLEWEPFAETTLKLTTMRTDLPVPMTTRICMKEAP